MSHNVGLQQNQYYWVRHPEGTRFIAKLEADQWWVVGHPYGVNITQDQIICIVKAPEN